MLSGVFVTDKYFRSAELCWRLKKKERSEKGLILYFSCLLGKKKSVLNYDLGGGEYAWKALPEK